MFKGIRLKRKPSALSLERKRCSPKCRLFQRTEPHFVEIPPIDQIKRNAMKLKNFCKSDLRIVDILPNLNSTSTAGTQTCVSTASEAIQTVNSIENSLNSEDTKGDNNLKLRGPKVKDLVHTLEAELGNMHLFPKLRHNSDCTVNEEVEIEPRVTRKGYSLDEDLQTATEKLIKELERLHSQGKYPTMEKSSNIEEGFAGDQTNNCCVKPNQEKAYYKRLPKRAHSERCATFYYYTNNDNSTGSEEYDWLEEIRKVANDKTLTPQQREKELDQIADLLIRQRNGLS
ncbi:unnamed protein product [Rodentolepis nana]|uniref:PPP1R35_C domain-containing protein n=1 Tax=Rodentolepis nana TaxID=102285 RepID=A0A0R3TBM9_RODNA|nr:unnamed protein product [Rodentolepis nana]